MKFAKLIWLPMMIVLMVFVGFASSRMSHSAHGLEELYTPGCGRPIPQNLNLLEEFLIWVGISDPPAPTYDSVTRPSPLVAYPDNIKPEQMPYLRLRGTGRPPLMVRKGVVNVAAGKLATSNKITFGKIDTLTDGNIECATTDLVLKLTAEPAAGFDEDESSWVTVDLGREYDVEAICVWHNYKRPTIYEGVIVQISTDKDFTAAKTETVFNNDYEDMAYLGAGRNKLYPASFRGELIRVGAMGVGRRARYVRVYTDGVLNDFASMPAFLEIGVYARNSRATAPAPIPAPKLAASVLKAAVDARVKAEAAAQAAVIKAEADLRVKQRAAAEAAAAKADPERAAKEAALQTAYEKASIAAGLVKLEIKLPKRGWAGEGPQPPRLVRCREPNVEFVTPWWKRRPAFYVPKGTVNLAKGAAVTVSEEPMVGEVSQIVDGETEQIDDNLIDLDSGPCWVTVDLEKRCEIFAIVMWHRFNRSQWVFRDVIVETADDKDFITNKRILFNNDHDGSLGKGHGVGTDWQYVETYEGKLVDAKGIKARYVRFWSNGNVFDESTYWIEAQVFGRTVKK